jgi:hypothetical protein
VTEQEHLLGLECATAWPGCQPATKTVPRQQPHRQLAIESEHAVQHAHGLPGHRTHALQDRYRAGRLSRSSAIVAARLGRLASTTSPTRGDVTGTTAYQPTGALAVAL